MMFVGDNILGILIAVFIILLILLIKRKLAFFSSKDMPFIRPTFMETIKFMSMNYWTDFIMKTYKRERDKSNACIGMFHSFLEPIILVLDPAMSEKMLIKDFSHFQDHGFEMDAAEDPLSKHLFNLRGDQWRTLRHKLLPTFTSGKLKGMVPTMAHCAQMSIDEMKKDESLREDVNLKELFRRYNLYVTASCVFGIDLESVKDANCEFTKILKKSLAPSVISQIKMLILIAFPKLSKLVGLKLFNQEVEDFFLKLTKDALEIRKSSGVKRNDFVQLLLELKEKGNVEMDIRDLEEDEKKKIQQTAESDTSISKLEMTDELLSAQAFVFIVAGFDNTSYLVSVTNYMLSKHKDIQQRVRDEVREAKRKHGGMNYQALRDMKLLEASINEALRIYPPIVAITRLCNKTYSMSNGMTIEKGMHLMIPCQEFQNDSQYWSEPEKFNPERFFTDDITPGTYLPFGDGPRICIAQRMALLTGKIILAELIETFELLPSRKTKEPIKLKVDLSPDVEGGFWGNFKPLSE